MLSGDKDVSWPDKLEEFVFIVCHFVKKNKIICELIFFSSDYMLDIPNFSPANVMTGGIQTQVDKELQVVNDT